jgi:hypothetical protein
MKTAQLTLSPLTIPQNGTRVALRVFLCVIREWCGMRVSLTMHCALIHVCAAFCGIVRYDATTSETECRAHACAEDEDVAKRRAQPTEGLQLSRRRLSNQASGIGPAPRGRAGERAANTLRTPAGAADGAAGPGSIHGGRLAHLSTSVPLRSRPKP